MGDAHEPGVGGESVLFIFIRQRRRDKHKRSVRPNQKKRGGHLPTVAHTKFRVMAGLGHKVVECFELARLLHCRKFEPEEKINQAANKEKLLLEMLKPHQSNFHFSLQRFPNALAFRT